MFSLFVQYNTTWAQGVTIGTQNMKNNASSVYALFLIVGDFLALLAAFTAAYIIRVKLDPQPLIRQIPALTYLYAFLAVLPLWILVHAFIGLYSQETYEKRFSELGRLFIGSFVGILVVIGYNFITNGKLFPARLVPVYGFALGFTFLLLLRTIARYIRHTLFRYGIGVSNLLIIGDTPASESLALTVSNTRWSGQRVLGIVGLKTKKFAYFGSLHEALETLHEPPHGIIQTELYKSPLKNSEILQYTQEHHVAYRFMPGNSDLFVGNITVELFASLPMIAVHQTALIGWGRVVKRLFDLFVGSLVLILTSPLFLLISLTIALFDHGGPVLFRQKRLTRFNREFYVYKFRSLKQKYSGMTPEEAFEKMGKQELSERYRANGDFLPNDPRISVIGRFLRRTSLDELPQLINVLRGDLSLVGPRALIPQELDAYEKRHAILSVKSGLTGLAQISGRRDISFDERRKLDMYYVQNWSFWLDLSILLRTLRVVITGSGAK
jgi:exopolysaccharide biosynthesis polyprenyl glycosylphosphotransferase